MSRIVLATLNARYAHAALALRWLKANLDADLAADCELIEFVIGSRTEEVVARLLAAKPRLIGFSVYLWNVEETTRIIAMLRVLAPEVRIVIGGPEVSHETAEQAICRLADTVITGPGEISFNQIARAWLEGPRPLQKIVPGREPDLDRLRMPYALYDAADLAHRHLYVEASRGCPFKCEFCLSALDRTAVAFPLDRFLEELDALYRRGARTFKFVDRTFNLKVRTSTRILEFFLERIEARPEDPCFVHFELIPDHLPEALRSLIARFPSGTLQFEIGIQTWNPQVQALISRRQDNERAEANLRWLLVHSQAHLHVDLIAGLPGEGLDSLAAGFDRLVAIGPHEIQLGILKRLRGAPIARHTEAYGMRFNPYPPYNLLANRDLDFVTMQRIARLARYWDLLANSGRFRASMPMLLSPAEGAFQRLLRFSDWVYALTGATHRLAPERLAELLGRWLKQEGHSAAEVEARLAEDKARWDEQARQARQARQAPRLGAVPERQRRFIR